MAKKYLKCPQCASLVKKEDKKCSTCGYSFDSQTGESVPVEKGNINCPSCGAKIEAVSVFCKICGKPVKKGESIRR